MELVTNKGGRLFSAQTSVKVNYIFLSHLYLVEKSIVYVKDVGRSQVH